MSSSKGFTCDFPGCNTSYRRKEHLSRHKARHTQKQSFKCTICDRGFGRNDTLRRHMRRDHKVNEPPPRTKYACTNCRHTKSRCEGGSPCSECLRRRIPCSLNGPDGETENASPSSLRSQGPNNIPYGPDKVQHYLKLYFSLFHPHWPFVHRASFNMHNETPLLVQSMVVMGLWVSKERSAQSAAIDLHKTLNSAIRQQTEKWDASVAENASSTCSWPIPTYQAILLHIIFSLIYKGGAFIGLDLKPSLPSADIELLDSLVLSCRRLGLFYYPNMLARYQQNELVSFVWICIEEVKRYNLALYKLCRALSSSVIHDKSGTHGVTGEGIRELTANELQFPMPKNDPLWNAMCKEEWDSAITNDFEPARLYDTMEEEWISKSAEVLRFFGQ